MERCNYKKYIHYKKTTFFPVINKIKNNGAQTYSENAMLCKADDMANRKINNRLQFTKGFNLIAITAKIPINIPPKSYKYSKKLLCGDQLSFFVTSRA
jgi:hypothetical protein